MGNVTVNVKGLKELGQAMGTLERKVRNRIAVKAMRRGGVIIRDQARANAPILKQSVPHRRSGTVRKAISTRTKIEKGGKVRTYIWVKGLKVNQVLKFKGKSGKSGSYNPRDPFYWRFLEFGTSNMPAKPFMRPAFQQSKGQAEKEIIKTLRDDIIREGQK